MPGPSDQETNSSAEQLAARDRLREAFVGSPLPPDELIANLGLYIRGSLLVKFLVLNELYLRVRDLPGAIVEFGTWWGQSAVIFENLRAIHEPFNKTRSIIAFDTFTGYHGFSDHDPPSEVLTDGGYSVTEGYDAYLRELLAIHEANNILSHVASGHEIVAGDVRETAPRFFSERPHLTVALAYFDMGLYEPTRAALEAIKPHVVPGTVLLLDEFTMPDARGEARAFKEVFGGSPFRIETCRLTPMRAIVTLA